MTTLTPKLNDYSIEELRAELAEVQLRVVRLILDEGDAFALASEALLLAQLSREWDKRTS